ncbi:MULTISPECIES: hypothetical protein [Moorena]|nr:MULTISPECIES: hypothetical protein [Moorena]NEQ18109.1 hypothetical protein [Moorena sp. SIO3E2]NEP37270.1 hypothetical protein [Moorena sp. SIO3B2]NEP68593.1 hypothetical protein [Moorena sp. SIO3A5]NER91319.1 hypothetical protein [Moorena sp. SIO3A2]NES46241.1 hypothetical protein [Moorena sp. SIO2C4]
MGLAKGQATRLAFGHATRSHGCLTVRLPQRLGFRNGYYSRCDRIVD